jgi:hypothetical protein
MRWLRRRRGWRWTAAWWFRGYKFQTLMPRWRYLVDAMASADDAGAAGRSSVLMGDRPTLRAPDVLDLFPCHGDTKLSLADMLFAISFYIKLCDSVQVSLPSVVGESG